MREMDGGRMDEGKEVNERGGQGVRSWGEKGGGSVLEHYGGGGGQWLGIVCVCVCLLEMAERRGLGGWLDVLKAGGSATCSAMPRPRCGCRRAVGCLDRSRRTDEQG